MKKGLSMVMIWALVLSLFLGLSPALAEDVEVVFWHSTSGALGDELQAIVDEYNNTHEGVHVNAVYQGYEGTDKVILAYQTQDTANACDINIGLTSTIPAMLELDWTAKVADLANTYGSTISQEDYYPSMARSVSYGGQMIAIPFLNSTLVMYYNADALQQAGYDAPPATMDELAEYVKALTQRDASGTVTRYGFECQVKRYQLVNYISSQNENAFFGDMEGGRAGAMTKITAGEDGTLKAFLEKLDALVETGGYQFVEGKVAEEFAAGTTAIALFSSSKCGNVNSLVGDSFQWMTAPIPKVNESDTSGSSLGGSCLVLFHRGDDARMKAAWDFAQYLSTPENQYRIAILSGYIPTTKGTEELPEMIKFYEENPEYKTALDVIKASSPMAQEPMDLCYNEINSAITDSMLRFCNRELDVDGAVAAIVDSCNRLLDEWHEAND